MPVEHSPAPGPPRRFLRFDRALSLLLFGLPALLAFTVSLTAVTVPVVHFNSGDEFADWLFNAALQAQHDACWQGVKASRAADNWLPESYYFRSNAYYRESVLFGNKLADAIQQQLDLDPHDPRVIWLAAAGMPIDYRDYDNSLQTKSRFLLEQDAGGMLDRQGLELLAYFINQVGPFELVEQERWRGLNISYFDLGDPSQSALTAEVREQVTDILRRVDSLPPGNAQHLELRFTQLMNNDDFAEALALLGRYPGLEAAPSDVGMLASLGLQEPDGLDDITRAQLQFFGLANWNNTLRMDYQKVQQASRELLASGSLDKLQQLHEFLWKLGGMGSPGDQLGHTAEMLSALPPSVLHDPANQEFRLSQQDIYALTSNSWTANDPGLLQQAVLLLDYQLSGERLGLYGPNPMYQDYYTSQPTRSRIIEQLGPNAAEQFERIRNLDWTSLDLSSAQPADFVDPAEQAASTDT
ncbi:MAG: hypothetical protein H7A35_15875 [Planctomycetales bacterium]|nr:hypothetical protein [bacterium]UNM08307.1 MAG: hypothetical protein H7A35_15875 [Planctomycetales bacterium]